MHDLITGPVLLPSQVLCFSCWGTENSQMVPNQENMEADQPVRSHSHTQQPCRPQTCVQEHGPGVKKDSLISFPGYFDMFPVLLFKILNYFIPSGVYLEGHNAVSNYKKD